MADANHPPFAFKLSTVLGSQYLAFPDPRLSPASHQSGQRKHSQEGLVEIAI
jgi:hypothetical protein